MSSSIRELVAGLRRDGWSEYFVTMLRCFADDSGSGGDSKWFVLAGYVASVSDWLAFDPEWRAALAADPPIGYFHAAEAESLKREFSGFTTEQRNTKIDRLIEVIIKHARQAIYVRVRQKDYDDIIKAQVPEIWDNAYYSLFPAFVSAATSSEKYRGKSDPIHFVFDSHERFEKPSKNCTARSMMPRYSLVAS